MKKSYSLINQVQYFNYIHLQYTNPTKWIITYIFVCHQISHHHNHEPQPIIAKYARLKRRQITRYTHSIFITFPPLLHLTYPQCIHVTIFGDPIYICTYSKSQTFLWDTIKWIAAVAMLMPPIQPCSQPRFPVYVALRG